jgi:hypothetical protein
LAIGFVGAHEFIGLPNLPYRALQLLPDAWRLRPPTNTKSTAPNNIQQITAATAGTPTNHSKTSKPCKLLLPRKSKPNTRTIRTKIPIGIIQSAPKSFSSPERFFFERRLIGHLVIMDRIAICAKQIAARCDFLALVRWSKIVVKCSTDSKGGFDETNFSRRWRDDPGADRDGQSGGDHSVGLGCRKGGTSTCGRYAGPAAPACRRASWQGKSTHWQRQRQGTASAGYYQRLSTSLTGELAMPITEIEPPKVIARRVFDALCERFPDKYIALVQPRSVADDRPVRDRNRVIARSDQPGTKPI